MVIPVNYVSRGVVLRRSAFTMIELIFAIVVIAIALLSVPLMTETNNRALERSLAQEAVFLASSVLSVSTTEVWDNRSIVDTGESDVYVVSKILDVNDVGSGSAYARIDQESNIRIGGVREDKHRQFFDYNTSKTAAQQPKPVGDAGFTVALDNSVAAITGYKFAYTVNGKRVFVDDTAATPFIFPIAASGGATNLKMTEVTIYDDDGEVAKLRAYTANIGEADYAKRRF